MLHFLRLLREKNKTSFPSAKQRERAVIVQRKGVGARNGAPAPKITLFPTAQEKENPEGTKKAGAVQDGPRKIVWQKLRCTEKAQFSLRPSLFRVVRRWFVSRCSAIKSRRGISCLQIYGKFRLAKRNKGRGKEEEAAAAACGRNDFLLSPTSLLSRILRRGRRKEERGREGRKIFHFIFSSHFFCPPPPPPQGEGRERQ